MSGEKDKLTFEYRSDGKINPSSFQYMCNKTQNYLDLSNITLSPFNENNLKEKLEKLFTSQREDDAKREDGIKVSVRDVCTDSARRVEVLDFSELLETDKEILLKQISQSKIKTGMIILAKKLNVLETLSSLDEYLAELITPFGIELPSPLPCNIETFNAWWDSIHIEKKRLLHEFLFNTDQRITYTGINDLHIFVGPSFKYRDLLGSSTAIISRKQLDNGFELTTFYVVTDPDNTETILATIETHIDVKLSEDGKISRNVTSHQFTLYQSTYAKHLLDLPTLALSNVDNTIFNAFKAKLPASLEERLQKQNIKKREANSILKFAIEKPRELLFLDPSLINNFYNCFGKASLKKRRALLKRIEPLLDWKDEMRPKWVGLSPYDNDPNFLATLHLKSKCPTASDLTYKIQVDPQNARYLTSGKLWFDKTKKRNPLRKFSIEKKPNFYNILKKHAVSADLAKLIPFFENKRIMKLLSRKAFRSRTIEALSLLIKKLTKELEDVQESDQKKRDNELNDLNQRALNDLNQRALNDLNQRAELLIAFIERFEKRTSKKQKCTTKNQHQLLTDFINQKIPEKKERLKERCEKNLLDAHLSSLRSSGEGEKKPEKALMHPLLNKDAKPSFEEPSNSPDVIASAEIFSLLMKEKAKSFSIRSKSDSAMESNPTTESDTSSRHSSINFTSSNHVSESSQEVVSSATISEQLKDACDYQSQASEDSGYMSGDSYEVSEFGDEEEFAKGKLIQDADVSSFDSLFKPGKEPIFNSKIHHPLAIPVLA